MRVQLGRVPRVAAGVLIPVLLLATPATAIATDGPGAEPPATTYSAEMANQNGRSVHTMGSDGQGYENSQTTPDGPITPGSSQRSETAAAPTGAGGSGEDPRPRTVG
jgi:hypothetical protein